MRKPLSPQTQVVLDAALNIEVADHVALSTTEALCREVAAVLRAAVKQSAYRICPGLDVINAFDLLDIADELEAVG